MLVAEIKRIGLSLDVNRHTVAQSRWGEDLSKKPNWNGNLQAVIAEDGDQAIQRLAAQARKYLEFPMKDLGLRSEDLWFEIGFSQVESDTGFFWPSLSTSYAARYRLSDAQPLRSH